MKEAILMASLPEILMIPIAETTFHVAIAAIVLLVT